MLWRSRCHKNTALIMNLMKPVKFEKECAKKIKNGQGGEYKGSYQMGVDWGQNDILKCGKDESRGVKVGVENERAQKKKTFCCFFDKM